VSGEVKDVNLTLPDGFPAKDFMHRNGFAIRRAAPVKVFNRQLEPV
jgi:hypothetical protein